MNHQDLLLTFYGDDFTGSTDAMEALALAGIRTLLFLEPPEPEMLGEFPGLRAVGVAGSSRAMSPEGMDEDLTPALEGLKTLGAPLCHYKICSTFDSSPEVGNIGHAAEIGKRVFNSPGVPLLAGVPKLGRYTLFGNLFARSGPESEIFRLDRHPTMRHHPITPMDESDLTILLSRQTNMPAGVLNILELKSPDVDDRFASLLASGAEIAVLDILEDEQLPVIGRLIWERAQSDTPVYTIGSSGIEYALTAYWQQQGRLPEPPEMASRGSVEQLVVVSGSCSPVTERQIRRALADGFAEVALRPERLVDPDLVGSECQRAIAESRQLLGEGRSVVLHTCLGPTDPRQGQTVQKLLDMGWDRLSIKLRSGQVLGEALGGILHQTLKETGLQRAVVAGGDTSGHVARQLGITALEMIAPSAPGSPLCRAYDPHSALDGLEIVFKGGQVGTVDYFERVRTGHAGTALGR